MLLGVSTGNGSVSKLPVEKFHKNKHKKCCIS